MYQNIIHNLIFPSNIIIIVNGINNTIHQNPIEKNNFWGSMTQMLPFYDLCRR